MFEDLKKNGERHTGVVRKRPVRNLAEQRQLAAETETPDAQRRVTLRERAEERGLGTDVKKKKRKLPEPAMRRRRGEIK